MQPASVTGHTNIPKPSNSPCGSGLVDSHFHTHLHSHAQAAAAPSQPFRVVLLSAQSRLAGILDSRVLVMDICNDKHVIFCRVTVRHQQFETGPCRQLAHLSAEIGKGLRQPTRNCRNQLEQNGHEQFRLFQLNNIYSLLLSVLYQSHWRS